MILTVIFSPPSNVIAAGATECWLQSEYEEYKRDLESRYHRPVSVVSIERTPFVYIYRLEY